MLQPIKNEWQTQLVWQTYSEKNCRGVEQEIPLLPDGSWHMLLCLLFNRLGGQAAIFLKKKCYFFSSSESINQCD